MCKQNITTETPPTAVAKSAATTTPVVIMASKSTSTPSGAPTKGGSAGGGPAVEMESLVKKMLQLIQVETNFDKTNHEIHEQRLEKMKQILDESEKDDWMFEKIENLIAL